MSRLRFLTAGESHGPALAVIIEGLPAGLDLTGADINRDLARRQIGYGRGGRMAIEQDRAEILSGIRKGLTLGSPIALVIRNRDWENWRENMAAEPGPPAEPVTCPRPGHADLAGLVKYGFSDIRNVLERASARETAARVAAGAAARKLLAALSINIYSRVVRIGSVTDRSRFNPPDDYERIEASRLRCRSVSAENRMAELIDRVKARGESLGGIFEITVTGLPVGLGSYVHWDRRLDGRLAQALASIPAIKGVEIGAGFQAAARSGSRVQDEIFHDPGRGYFRKSNRAGGLEGGLTNGEPLLLRAAMKPIPTQSRPLRTVDIASGRPSLAHRERSDFCAVPAAAVVGEAMTALVLADAVLEKYGGDTLPDLRLRKNGA